MESLRRIKQHLQPSLHISQIQSLFSDSESSLRALLRLSTQRTGGKPSLVCDLMEIYRYLIEDLVIEFSQNLTQKDFIFKKEWFSSNRLGKRQVLGKDKTKELITRVYELWERKVVIPRFRHGKRQTIETLINEEAYILAKYLRGERKAWKPRITMFW